MDDNINRKYIMEDELLLTRAQTQKDTLANDLADFNARFPWIDASYLNTYQDDIDTAEQFPQDDTVKTGIKVLVADVNSLMTQGIAKLKVLFIFSKLTYPNNKVKQRVFGQKQMVKALRNVDKMISLLEYANSIANQNPYKTDLLTKGYTQPDIDALLLLAENLHAQNLIKEVDKVNRPITTKDRKSAYNTVFDHAQNIYGCAKVVYAGNAAKIKLYRVTKSKPAKAKANGG